MLPTLISALSLTLAMPPCRHAAPVPRRDFQVSAQVLPFTFRLLVREFAGATGTVIVRDGEVLLGNWTFAHWRDRVIIRRQEEDCGRHQ